MAKVLVTGANGFIGSHLVAALVARGDRVTCLVRKTSQVDRLRALDVRLTRGDVTDPDSLPAPVAGSQIVYHLAGCNRAFRAERFHEVNWQGGRNLQLQLRQGPGSPRRPAGRPPAADRPVVPRTPVAVGRGRGVRGEG